MGCRVDSPRNNKKVVEVNISVLSPHDARMSDNALPMKVRTSIRGLDLQRQGLCVCKINSLFITREWISFLDNPYVIWNSHT
jgi:hypothetical protein